MLQMGARQCAIANDVDEAVIGPPPVAGAIDELQLASSDVSAKTPVRPVRERESVPVPPPPPPVGSNLKGLFDRRRAPEPSTTQSELHELLDLPSTTPKREWDAVPDQIKVGASAAPVWKWRVDGDVRRETRMARLTAAGLAVIGIGVVLLAGGIAVTAQRERTASRVPAAARSVVQQATPAPAATTPAPVEPSRSAQPPDVAPQTPSTGAPAIVPASPDTWVVQVGAFSSHDRSLAMVERLTQSGFKAFEVPIETASQGLLYFVRVGPFKTARRGRRDAWHASTVVGARERLRSQCDLRSVIP
jgi:cell division septation protein DedD